MNTSELKQTAAFAGVLLVAWLVAVGICTMGVQQYDAFARVAFYRVSPCEVVK